MFEIIRDPQRLDRGERFTYNGIESGALKPVIDSTFLLERIGEAHRYMESNQEKGKIVVTVYKEFRIFITGIIGDISRLGENRT